MSFSKKLFVKKIKLIYRDAKSQNKTAIEQMPSVKTLVTPALIIWKVGYCQNVCGHLEWIIFTTLSMVTYKNQNYLPVHTLISGKKKIIEGLTVEFNDHLKYNKDHEIICYSLVKVDFSKYRNNHNHNKWGIKHEENIMDNIKTNIYKKKLELKNMNFKLNANEDLLILPGFWVTSQNADGYFNDSNK